METHIFYLDEQSNLKEFIFEGTEDVGRPGSLNSQNITPAAGTKLASYWPSLVFQNSGNTISEVRYNCTTRPQTCWILEDLQIPRAAPSAALAEVPMGRNLEGIFLYYQRADKDLVNLAWGNETGEWKQSKSTAPPLHSSPLTSPKRASPAPSPFPTRQPYSPLPIR